MYKAGSLVLALLAPIVISGCGGDDGAGPDSPDFPSMPTALITSFCVRSDASPGVTRNGTIDGNDCGDAQAGYFESYRVRVSATGDCTFDASSSFDNVLSLIWVQFDDQRQNYNLSLVTMNDDRSQSNLNALIENESLTAGEDYLILIGGFDGDETGSYSLAIR